MRSVVVVLPASMCAMMPMFRVRASGYSRMRRSFPAALPFASCSICATACLSITFLGIFSAGSAISGPPSHTRPAPAGGRSEVRSRSPSVVRECLVRLGHLVHVLAPLDRGARALRGVHDLPDQAVGHGVLASRTAVVDEPPQRQRRAPVGANLDRHLIGGTADPARAD